MPRPQTEDITEAMARARTLRELHAALFHGGFGHVLETPFDELPEEASNWYLKQLVPGIKQVLRGRSDPTFGDLLCEHSDSTLRGLPPSHRTLFVEAAKQLAK